MTNDEQQGFKFALCQDMRVLKTQIPPVLKTTDSLWGWLEPEHNVAKAMGPIVLLMTALVAFLLVSVFRNKTLNTLIFGTIDLNWLPASVGCLILLEKIICLHDFGAILLILELLCWSELKSTLFPLWEPVTSHPFSNKVMDNLRHQDLHSLCWNLKHEEREKKEGAYV